jgi:hypothetical protein
VVGKRIRRVNVMQLGAEVSKCNKDTCRKYSRNWRKGIKENSGGSEFKCDILDTL